MFYIICCRRPTSLRDRTRDSDDDDYQDRDYDIAALANNLSQAYQYGIYGSDDIEEVRTVPSSLFSILSKHHIISHLKRITFGELAYVRLLFTNYL